MDRRIRWGIIGPGNIAGKMAEALSHLPDAELYAVGSRTPERLPAFADKYGVERRYESYELLAADPKVDIVYVSTPHSHHASATSLCLEAGKPVLCEKPLTVNARQAEEVIHLAREKRLFLMEAMWTRFMPLMTRFRELIDGGAIGEIRMLQADFGFKSEFNPKGRLYDLNLAGGALLDIGIYTVSFASWLFGEPSRIAGLADIGKTGVDEQNAEILGYEDGKLAILSSAIRVMTSREATVTGTEGTIRVHAPWWSPSKMTVNANGKEELIEIPFEGNGFEYEAAEAMRCLREGRLESDIMPLDESLAIMRTMDAIRAQWGLKYPME